MAIKGWVRYIRYPSYQRGFGKWGRQLTLNPGSETYLRLVIIKKPTLSILRVTTPLLRAWRVPLLRISSLDAFSSNRDVDNDLRARKTKLTFTPKMQILLFVLTYFFRLNE